MFSDYVATAVLWTIFVALPIYGLVKWLAGRSRGPVMFCRACGSIGPTRRQAKGNAAVELFLWLFFLVPGIIYTLWSRADLVPACAKCGRADVIPGDSPIAIAALVR